MAYDENYFRAYREYLEEPSVRRAHDGVFDMFLAHYNSQSLRFRGLDSEISLPGVADLGCGQTYEYHRYGKSHPYIGFDLNPADNRFLQVYRADYRARDFTALLRSQALFEDLDTFVSLFSSEITASFYNNTKLYEHLFQEVPHFCFGFVSGFYYTNLKDRSRVAETGDVVSWQTLDPIEAGASDVYSEVRITLPVPSQMFGPDVVEVWRILTRK